MRNSAIWKLSLLSLAVVGCGAKSAPDEYRQSDGRIVSVQAQSTDHYLQVLTFVELKDGTWQFPKRYFDQKHFTPIGVRDVEKPGGLMSIVVSPRIKPLFLPTDDEIKDYLFMYRTAKKGTDPKKEVEWSEWHLFRVAKAEVLKPGTFTFPEHLGLKEATQKEQALCAKLIATFEAALAESLRKMNEPIKHDTKVPWYAR
jgi:hypothetical protein